jgi:hypothetical protein
MIDLAYRPLFLEAGRISRSARCGSPLDARGTLSFRSPHDDPLESLLALAFWLLGAEPDIRLEAGAGIVSLRAGGLRLECAFPGGAASPGPAGGWSGEGSFESSGYGFRFAMGDTDRLFVRDPGGGAERRLFLPEGDGAYYAELEARDASARGARRAALPADIRERVRSMAAAARKTET